MGKKLGVVDFLNAKPLIYAIEENKVPHSFELLYDIPSQIAVKLLNKEINAGLVPSIHYAKYSVKYRIVPEVCIASRGAVKSIRLYFRKDLRDIKSVAVDISSMTSVVLARVILSEKYDVRPKFIAMKPNLENMLLEADAALLIGDNALFEPTGYASYLDLGDEWDDLTGLPFVYALWVGRRESLSEDDVLALINSKNYGIQNIDTISYEASQRYGVDFDFCKSYLTENLFYELGEQEIAGMKEFFTYAFYYGVIDFIPEIKFYEFEKVKGS
ncbi:chorismate dehydratase [Candidatus Thermokryptus mobilis]|uniref:Chorismate dehydratase n=1 Tax=Candidatus Thermokryptus mobilis TaxID=1643428 RepID=A0A0S4NDI1_9BACT|nr:menaquinone biosynthesis protein [Candidatus Thermokryptus mobilis]CUU08077.1 chorismate dehydratase [Candidatus Thermokryptus mobilis]